MVIRVWAKPCGLAPGPTIRHGEPVTFGVPLPRGAVRDPLAWTAIDAQGRKQRVQTRVLERWSDKSARWVLVDARIDADASAGTEFQLETSDPAAASPGPAIVVLESGGAVAVDTGAARFTLRAAGAFPFDAVDVAEAPALSPGASGLMVTDSLGEARRAEIRSVEVEERGPLRVVVLIRGIVPAGAGPGQLVLTARVHLYAGLPTVRLLVTLTNPNRAVHKGGFWDLGDPGSILVEDASIALGFPGAVSPTVRASLESGAPWAAYETPFEVYQDSSGGERWQSSNHLNRERRVPTSFRGYRVRGGSSPGAGLRATPIVVASCAGRTIAATLPCFWQNFPKAIEVGDAGVALRLFPGQYAALHEIQAGEQKTHEVFLSFGADEVTAEPVEWCRARLVPCVDPAWVMASQAVPFLALLDPAHAALVNAAIQGPDRFEVKREVIDEYGWRHFGEIYGDHEGVRHAGPAPLVSHYNNQYDPIAGFAQQFLRTGDPRWWTSMTELAAHVIDIDVYHTDKDKSAYNGGMFWHTYHYGDADTATHRTYPASARGRIHGGGPSADHNYGGGLALHYLLTGDEASRRVVVDLAQFVINIDDGQLTELRWLDRGSTGRATLSAGYYGPGRGPANSLNALIEGHRLSSNDAFMRKADELIRRVVHPSEGVGRHGLGDPERRWFYTMFLQSLGRFLHYKVERGELDDLYGYGRASLVHYGRWMTEHECPYLEKPEKLEFPTETWAAQDIRKSDVFALAAVHAEGSERERFLGRARFFHEYSVSTLSKMPTRALARPVVVLLTSGATLAWVDRSPGSLPMPTVSVDYGRPASFEPQRARAIRKLAWLAIAGAAVFAATCLTWLLVWR